MKKKSLSKDTTRNTTHKIEFRILLIFEIDIDLKNKVWIKLNNSWKYLETNAVKPAL